MVHRERRGGSGRTERTPPAPQSCFGRTAGHEATAGIMILASAMSHIVGRPAIRMEGGTINPMERLCPPPSGESCAMDESLTQPCRVSDEGLRVVKLCLREKTSS